MDKKTLELTALFCLVPQFCFAGVYYESEIHSSIDSAVQHVKTYVSGTQMKTLVDDKQGWIINLKDQKLVDFNLENHSSSETSLRQFSSDIDPLGMGIEKHPQGVLRKMGKRRKLLGCRANGFKFFLGPHSYEELWVTQELPFTQEVTNFWKAFYRSQAMELEQFLGLKSRFELLSKIEGFVLDRKTIMENFWEEEKVLKVEERDIPAQVFNPPT